MTRFNLGILLSLSLSCLATATTVSVLELGASGTVHSTAATSPLTSSNGILSFWKSIHSADSAGVPRKHSVSQYPGMTVVPDLFSKPAGGLVIGVFGDVTLEDMPVLSNLLEEESSVGQFHVRGEHGRTLMRLSNAQAVPSEDFASALATKAASAVSKETGNRLDAISVRVGDDSKDIDASLGRMLESISQSAREAGSSVIVHIVIEDGKRRRLEDNNNGDDAANYEIPGYYDDNGNFHTRFRTIFEIQYFNVVLWTALGLMTILASANYMTMYMPLMPDTLLFGESAKMVAE